MTNWIKSLVSTALITLLFLMMPATVEAADGRTCLVLSDGYVSEYAWGAYSEAGYPPSHPGHEYFVRGVLDWAGRFDRWLEGWDVKQLELEKNKGKISLDGIDLVILDEARQSVARPYEAQLLDFVRNGGSLLVYAGSWGLGGRPKNEYSVEKTVSTYQDTALGKILPVGILSTPDLVDTGASRRPVFLEQALGEGIDTTKWEVSAVHNCSARGEVLAELDGKPLICRGEFGKGTVVVYTGDDLAWVRQDAKWPASAAEGNINRFSGTLWRRLAGAAVGDANAVPAMPDPEPSWEKPAAFAHPDQPMNFLWTGYLPYDDPTMQRLLVKDLVMHSSTLFGSALEPAGNAGIQTWISIGHPLWVKTSVDDDKSTWMVNADGKRVNASPWPNWTQGCYNNPRALRTMAERMAARVSAPARPPWVTYVHLGDETDYEDCYCEYCHKAFQEELGYELPVRKNDFSPEYLDRWIDYQLFKNRSIGRMYAQAAAAAHKEDPGLKVFASLPQSAGMCRGDDQFNTQSGFDLLWDHTYPGTMPIRVGLNASLMEETGVLQGRPYVPVLDLLQAFDSYDRAPRVPPAEYIREMAWQAIAHGVDSVGWFVYNAFWWNLPGTEAWEEMGRLAREVLEPLTPTLYEMRNAPEPVGLLYSYSQEAVDGLKMHVWDEKERPWKGVIRWWSLHATQEAYEVLKYAHVPVNVVSEHRLFEGGDLPWKVIIIPYVEHLHTKSRKALQSFMADGGTVYVGANSTLELPGVKKLPVSFDTKFTTWWPEDKVSEWNQRRVRTYMIGPFLEKAEQMGRLLSNFRDGSMVSISDPEIVYNVREAGAARYLFFVNDHQTNPESEELRKRRQQRLHFMLMPMEFPKAETTVTVRGKGYLYALLSSPGEPVEVVEGRSASLKLEMDGGDGRVFVLLPERIEKVEFTSQPVRSQEGVRVEARVTDKNGVMEASLPLQIDISCEAAQQTVYATTKNGILSWTAPFLKEFPETPLTVTVTDLASGKSVRQKTRLDPKQ